MKRSRILGVVAGAALAVGLMGAAAGACEPVPQPVVGGCPTGDGWGLLPTSSFLDALDNGNIADQNGDGFACFRINPGQSAKHDGANSYTWKDNTNPLPVV
jgi:hypothetical protein